MTMESSVPGYLTHNQIVSRIQYIHDFLDLVFSCKITEEKKPDSELAQVLSDIVYEYGMAFDDFLYKPTKAPE